MSYTNYDQIPLILTVDDVAGILGVGRNTAYDLVRCGKIRSIRTGHIIRITKESLIDFMNQ